LFAKFGQSFSDLWKKTLDEKDIVHKAEAVNKTDFGLKLTTTGIFADTIQGTVKAEYADKTGKYEGELTTKNKAWGKVTLEGVATGADVAVSGGFDPESKDEWIKGKGGVKAEVDYRTDSWAVSGRATGGYRTVGKSVAPDLSMNVQAEAVCGSDGLSVGVCASVPLGEKDQKLLDVDKVDMNVACQYEKDKYTATFKTTKNCMDLSFSNFFKVSSDQEIGVEVTAAGSKPGAPRTLNFATRYQLNLDTGPKFRANTDGEVRFGVEHRLRDPRVKINAAAVWKAKGPSFSVERFGLGLTFGDF